MADEIPGYRKYAALYTPFFLERLARNPLVYADVGARDDICVDMAALEALNPDCLRVIGFEPEPDAAQELNRKYAGRRRFYPKALWNRSGRRNLYITKSPCCSSLFPPNQEMNRRFDRGMWEPRELVRTVTVECATLDEVHTELGGEIDFMKLDTQGAEYEILEGGAETLRNEVFAVIAETWTAPTYRGIRLHGEVCTLMDGLGFELMTYDLAGLMLRNTPNDVPVMRRHQLNGFEYLFFRAPEEFIETCKSPEKPIKAAGLADLFGFPDYAFDILSRAARRWPDQLAEWQDCAHVIANIKHPRPLSKHEAETMFMRIHW